MYVLFNLISNSDMGSLFMSKQYFKFFITCMMGFFYFTKAKRISVRYFYEIFDDIWFQLTYSGNKFFIFINLPIDDCRLNIKLTNFFYIFID